MKRLEAFVARTPKLAISAAIVIAALFFFRSVGFSQSSGVAATGTLTGTVTADKGEVRGLRVKARDTVRGISYTVYTKNGQYHIYNLPSGSYEVQLVEESFTSPVQRVQLR